MNHWNAYEVIWTAIAVVGVGLGAFNLWHSILDFRALGTIKNGRRLIAKSAMIRDSLRIAVAALAVAAGLKAGSLDGEPTNPLGAIAFIAALVVAVLFSGYDARIRILLLRDH